MSDKEANDSSMMNLVGDALEMVSRLLEAGVPFSINMEKDGRIQLTTDNSQLFFNEDGVLTMAQRGS